MYVKCLFSEPEASGYLLRWCGNFLLLLCNVPYVVESDISERKSISVETKHEPIKTRSKSPARNTMKKVN